MQTKIIVPAGVIFFYLLIVTLSGCKTTSNSYAKKGEATRIRVLEKPDVINLVSLREQMAPSLADRATKSRGLILGTAMSLATNAVKNMIAKSRGKYMADYSFALTDLYFYDQISTEGPFDPAGMQFDGFSIIRTFVDKQGHTDTALLGKFELDAEDPSEIINNSIFRLRLKSLDVNYVKAKMTRAQKNSINMDIEITFTSSYANESGQVFGNVDLGKFCILLRNAPIDRESPAYTHYYDSLKGTRVEGKSFIVPRSFGYYMNPDGIIARSFSQGAYSISVKVTESTRNKFVTRLLLNSSNPFIDRVGKLVK